MEWNKAGSLSFMLVLPPSVGLQNQITAVVATKGLLVPAAPAEACGAPVASVECVGGFEK